MADYCEHGVRIDSPYCLDCELARRDRARANLAALLAGGIR